MLDTLINELGTRVLGDIYAENDIDIGIYHIKRKGEQAQKHFNLVGTYCVLPSESEGKIYYVVDSVNHNCVLIEEVVDSKDEKGCLWWVNASMIETL